MSGRKLEEFPGMDYTIINVGEGTGGGRMKDSMPGDPDNWLPYILVDDVAASTAATRAMSFEKTTRRKLCLQLLYRVFNNDSPRAWRNHHSLSGLVDLEINYIRYSCGIQ